MANRLKVAKVLSIKTLHAQGWSQRRIARELGVSRGAVARQLQADAQQSPTSGVPDDSNRTKAPPGSEPAETSSNRAKAPPGSRSLCGPFREQILAKLDQGLSAQRIFQDLVAEHGFAGQYHSVRRFVAKLNQSTPLPFRRIEVAPGEEAQIDFGAGASVVSDDGRRRRTHVLRVVLSHSRKAYSEAVYRQTTDNLIHCLENAFWHFGGVPKTLVPDNLKAAVLKADWYDPDLNPKLRSFCEHYGTALLPTKPRTPRHKGKVERGVDYVQENALKGRTFRSLREQNDHLLHWETTVADTRIHGTTQQQVLKLFREGERHALQTLPLERFPCFQEGQRKVSRDGHVSVAKSYYSVPPEYLGRTLWVRWDSHLVRVLNDRMETISTHATQTPGRFSTLPEHIASEKISPVERGTEWLLKKVSFIGENTRTWSHGLVATRGVEAVRVLHGLLNLSRKYPSEVIEKACVTAHSYQAYRLQTIRKLIEHSAPKQGEFEFLDQHPIIRNLSDYGDVVRVDFRKEAYQR
jgi:transposase